MQRKQTTQAEDVEQAIALTLHDRVPIRQIITRGRAINHAYKATQFASMMKNYLQHSLPPDMAMYSIAVLRYNHVTRHYIIADSVKTAMTIARLIEIDHDSTLRKSTCDWELHAVSVLSRTDTAKAMTGTYYMQTVNNYQTFLGA
jgi:hypothetical protein